MPRASIGSRPGWSACRTTSSACAMPRASSSALPCNTQPGRSAIRPQPRRDSRHRLVGDPIQSDRRGAAEAKRTEAPVRAMSRRGLLLFSPVCSVAEVGCHWPLQPVWPTADNSSRFRQPCTRPSSGAFRSRANFWHTAVIIHRGSLGRLADRFRSAILLFMSQDNNRATFCPAVPS